MSKTNRAGTTYAVVVTEYLLAAGALYGLVWFAATRPTHDWGVGLALWAVLVCGEMTLALGLLVGLAILTVRLWRSHNQQQPQSSRQLVSFASQAAGWGLLWGAIGGLVACFSGLPGLMI